MKTKKITQKQIVLAFKSMQRAQLAAETKTNYFEQMRAECNHTYSKKKDALRTEYADTHIMRTLSGYRCEICGAIFDRYLNRI